MAVRRRPAGAIRSLRQHFALLDVNIPKLTGVQVVRKLREAGIPTRCIILTISRAESAIREASEAGADGYLLKGRASPPPDRRHQLHSR